ncbi:MAG: hypothetical protein V2I37_07890 [Marinilabiliaceae bacterium]|jgi:hypothetical protein|nr:hypothetical protein [Marinilabiliaceae bacterium]
MKEEQLNRTYSEFLDKHRIIPPDDLEKDVLSAIRKKQKYRIGLVASILTIAAVLLLMVTTTLIKPSQTKEMEYIEKVALLLEARAMLSTDKEDANSESEILYEDESIIIYSK